MTTSCVVAIALATSTIGQTANVTYVRTMTTGLAYPARLAEEPGGGVFVTDPPGKAVIAYDAAGAFLASYPIAQGPVGISVHSDGRIFVSRNDGKIGVYSAAFASLGVVNPAPLSLSGPNDLVFDPTTLELYSVDSGSHRVLVFAETAPNEWTLVRSWGLEGTGLGEFSSPQAIALDPDLGRVIVTDADNFRVQVFNTTGISLFKFGYRILFTATDDTAWFARSEGLAVDGCGNIYVTDALMGTLRIFSELGKELSSMNLPAVGYGTGAGQLRAPCGLLIDEAGKLYVANTNNNSVEVYNVSCTQGAVASVEPPAPRGEIGKRTVRAGAVRQSQASFQKPMPDSPLDVLAAAHRGEYAYELDLNSDRAVDMTDAQIAIDAFGMGTIEQFAQMAGLSNVAEHPTLSPPHVLDLPNRCGRCHSMDGSPGGMLTTAGQENSCQSCHSAGKIAGKAWIGPGSDANSHPWGVSPDDLDPQSELALHLDNGNVRCGTCHDPHTNVPGANFLRMGPLYEEVPITVPGTSTQQPMTEFNPTLCGECHADIVEQWHVAGHSHEDADPFIHYEWMIGNNWLCTGPGTPYAYCTAEGAGTASSASAAVCTGPGTPLACCTGEGTGTCSLSAAACIGPGQPWSCCTGAGTGSCSSRESCRQCHSGFGYQDFAVDFPDGTVQSSRWRGQWRAIDCLVCHSTHDAAQSESLLRIWDAVQIPNTPPLTISGAGPGATCISCHNGRRQPPIPNPPGVTTIHYLSGGVMLEGVNGVTLFDGTTYTVASSNHTSNPAVDCTTCHMAPGPDSGPNAGTVGGHTFRLVNHDTGYENVATTCGTAACHPGLATVNMPQTWDYDGDGTAEGIQDETRGLLDLVEAALNTAGAYRLLDETGHGVNPYWATSLCSGGSRAGLPCTGASGTFGCPGGTCTASVAPAELATVEDAIWNWEYVDNSGDFGVKNTGYAVGLLQIAYKGVTNNAVPGATRFRYDPAP